MNQSKYYAIYDFGIFPYALGDVLTWNVQTAIKAADAGRQSVDVLINIDPDHPASIFQSDFITADNCSLLFNELFGAFGTMPGIGNVQIFRSRCELLDYLSVVAADDDVVHQVVEDYKAIVAQSDDVDAVAAYFIKCINSHNLLNDYAQIQGKQVPFLQPSLGCMPDIRNLVDNHFCDKRIVVVHPRLRRLDTGMEGTHTYHRDSDFTSWIEFFKEAGEKFPQVQFFIVGRLQEKPLAFLRQPNVTSIRLFGMNLGHELTLMLESDLFIGTSSGFAALANFSSVPYYITGMNAASYQAYEIEEGAKTLPFACKNQYLMRGRETKEDLIKYLGDGLACKPRKLREKKPRNTSLDVRNISSQRREYSYAGSSTHRFYIDETEAHQEVSLIIDSKIEEIFEDLSKGNLEKAKVSYDQLITVFYSPKIMEVAVRLQNEFDIQSRGVFRIKKIMLLTYKQIWKIKRASEAATKRAKRFVVNVLISINRGTFIKDVQIKLGIKR